MKNRIALGLIPFALLSVAAKGGCQTTEEPISDGPDAATQSGCSTPEPTCPAGSTYSVAGCRCVPTVTTPDASGPDASEAGQPGAPVIVGHVPAPAFIAVDDTNVYVAPYESGQVGFVPKGGGTWTELDPIGATTIAIDANRVYTVSPSGSASSGLVVACAKTGCGDTPTTLASGQTGVWGVAVDDTNVYWTIQSAGGGGVLKAPLAGGSPTALVTGPSAISIAVSGGTVFYAGVSDLMSVPAAGGPSTVVYSTADGVSALALDATNIYFATTAGLVGRLPLGGGAATTLAAGQGNGVDAVAVDGANVYWVAAGADPQSGAIVSVPIAGGASRVIAGGQVNPEGIAVDATSVYWSVMGGSSGDGMIMKIAK